MVFYGGLWAPKDIATGRGFEMSCAALLHTSLDQYSIGLENTSVDIILLAKFEILDNIWLELVYNSQLHMSVTY